jgi:hypothetical protein
VLPVYTARRFRPSELTPELLFPVLTVGEIAVACWVIEIGIAVNPVPIIFLAFFIKAEDREIDLIVAVMISESRRDHVNLIFYIRPFSRRG